MVRIVKAHDPEETPSQGERIWSVCGLPQDPAHPHAQYTIRGLTRAEALAVRDALIDVHWKKDKT